MSLMGDLREAFKSDATFTLSEPNAKRAGSLPTVVVRSGGWQQGWPVAEVIVLTGQQQKLDPYTDGIMDAEELTRAAILVCYTVAGALPERIAAIPLHTFPVGDREFVGIMLRVTGDC